MAEQNLDIVIRVRGGTVASQEIKQVGDSAKGVGTATEETSKKTAGLSKAMKGLASGFAVYKGYSFIKGAVEETGNLAKATTGLQRITGMDTKTAAGWVDMAQQRGIQSKQLNQGFITLNKQIYAAAGGSKTAAGAFDALGLSGAALKALPANIRMGEIADSFKALPSGVDKAALAQKLFGRQAQALLPILNQSAKGLNDQVAAYAKSSGMNKETQKSAMEMAAKQREMGSAMTGVKVAVGTALIPVLVQVAQVLTPLAEAFAHAMQSSGLFRNVVLVLTAAIAAFVAVMIVGSVAVAGWVALAVGIAAALYLVYTHVGFVHTAVDAMVHAAVTAFAAFKAAVMAAFNWVKGNWPLLLGILTGPIGIGVALIITNFGKIKSTAVSVFNTVKSVIQSCASAISGVFVGAWNAVSSAVSAVVSQINSVVDAISKIVHAPSKIVSKVLGGAASLLQEGGSVTHGGAAIVGEAGPELVYLPTGSQVVPNHAIGGAAGSGGGVVHTHVYLDTREIASALGSFTADQQAAR